MVAFSRISVLVLALGCTAAAAQGPVSADAAKPNAAGAARFASQQCRTHATVSACDDALRWNPSDPSLLVAMGDALVRAQRPADAVRAYQRAATLAPDTPGIRGKIEAAQGSSSKFKTKKTVREAPAADTSSKRFSNSDPDTQTH